MSSLTPLKAIAPAKLNLSLHVHGKRADGYHDLESVVAFTEFGDAMTFRHAGNLQLTVDGPFARDAGNLEQNLVMRAARALQQHVGTAQGAHITLEKKIPVGAGLGGGSSDAATALRMLRALWGIAVNDTVLLEIAATLGSDVPMCVHAKPLVAKGRGEEISLLPYSLPPLWAVLIYPHHALATADIFKAYIPEKSLPHIAWTALNTPSILPSLRLAKNTLQRAAIAQCAPVGEILLALETAAQQPDLVRMSGSGSCCFALFDDATRAERLAVNIKKRYPHWWVASSALLSER